MNKHRPTYPGYGELERVLDDALRQAAAGKGKERHANDLPFQEQKIMRISEGLNSAEGLRYQVCKKTMESAGMDKAAAIREMHGAIVYAAATILFLEKQGGKSDSDIHSGS